MRQDAKRKPLVKRRNPSQQRSQERVSLILTSTAEILRSGGIGAVTTNSIAALAGIPVSSIYQYFPNKVAILSALFEAYLADITAVLDDFVTPERLNQPWEDFFASFIKAIYQQETRQNIESELENALALFPELVKLDIEHRERIANRLADILRQLGSTWSRARLRRIGIFVYEINNAVWRYRLQYPAPAKDHLAWGTAATLGVVGQCMPD